MERGIITKKYNFFDYLFIFLILQFTCVPFWTGYRLLLAFLIIIALFLYFRISHSFKFDKILILLFFIYSFIDIIQGFIWGFSFISLLSSFSFTFLFCYLLYKIYGYEFLILFEKVFRILVIISMIIWIAQNWIPGIDNIIKSTILHLDKYSTDQWPRSMLIYTYWDGLKKESYLFTRNAGFLHEPGAFATFIMLAIIINYTRGISLFNKKNILYICAMISTVSTAGYLSLIIFSLLLMHQKSARLISIAVLPFILYGSIYSYHHFSFMQNKIEDQITNQTAIDLNEGAPGRIIGARKSLYVLNKYPLFGRGLNTISQPDYDSPEFAGYGWISYVSKFGLIFGSLFIFFFFKGIYHFIKIYRLDLFAFTIITSAIMINLFSQSFISKPFFLIFFFFGIYPALKLRSTTILCN